MHLVPLIPLLAFLCVSTSPSTTTTWALPARLTPSGRRIPTIAGVTDRDAFVSNAQAHRKELRWTTKMLTDFYQNFLGNERLAGLEIIVDVLPSNNETGRSICRIHGDSVGQSKEPRCHCEQMESRSPGRKEMCWAMFSPHAAQGLANIVPYVITAQFLIFRRGEFVFSLEDWQPNRDLNCVPQESLSDTCQGSMVWSGDNLPNRWQVDVFGRYERRHIGIIGE
ncbi:MAG: hypothetical protein M1825_003989 [Sarcosagium campestre]|nr:MAG: hypothetical protein M1825_003989 [Sarcosagium campestre]